MAFCSNGIEFLSNGESYFFSPKHRGIGNPNASVWLKNISFQIEHQIADIAINNNMYVEQQKQPVAYNLYEIVKFTQKNLASEDEIFNYLNSLQHGIIEKILVAEVTDFGIIIETSRRLYVLQSNGELILINPTEEVVKWRVYPRSIQYTNQLHVIYNDRMEILSFNDDYFENQEKKLFGYRHTDL